MNRSTRASLRTPARENIANREYYRASETHDAGAEDVDVEYPADAEESGPQQGGVDTDTDAEQEEHGGGVQSREAYDFVEVSKRVRYSPSSSDVVLQSELGDVKEMSELDADMRERGLSRAERKKVLLELQDRLIAAREEAAEEAAKQRADELEREYDEVQRKGREEV